MSDIYFQGFWRMDWGLGNPNKTAALIAMLMVAVWGFAYWKRRGFWLSLPLFTILGVCLVHTFSRGGIIAAFSGILPLLLFLRRPFPWKRISAVIVAIWMIFGASIYLQAHERYGQSLVQEDRSVSNRLEIWKKAPTMMTDASGGWGIGNAGQAYMNWYQPLDRNESYRTLVSSHLTWLVELGWWGRFLYLAGWLMIFLVCLPSAKASWLSVPFGIWLALFFSASFSSVAESLWLWIVPGVAFTWSLVWRIRTRQRLNAKWWVLPPAVASLGLVLLFSVSDFDSPIRKTGDAVLIGSNSTPGVWVVYNKQVLGEKPGRPLRAALPNSPKMSVGLVEKIGDLPAKDLPSVVLAGDLPDENRDAGLAAVKTAKSLLLINPRFFPQEFVQSKQDLAILFGEFSQSPAASSWDQFARVQKLAGVGDFLPNWPDKILASVH